MTDYCAGYVMVVITGLINVCYRDWKRDEANFSKTKVQYLASLKTERARIFKDAGNEKFKMGEYTEAASLYSEALDFAPPSLESGNGDKKGHRW